MNLDRLNISVCYDDEKGPYILVVATHPLRRTRLSVSISASDAREYALELSKAAKQVETIECRNVEKAAPK